MVVELPPIAVAVVRKWQEQDVIETFPRGLTVRRSWRAAKCVCVRVRERERYAR
jgi:hypothetical protein